MLDFAATRIGGKFLDKAIDWGLAAVRGPEQERAARKVFVDAARSALADLGEDSITDESIAQAVATHFSDLVSVWVCTIGRRAPELGRGTNDV